ncbi:hypothetical protein CERSUDRAFT_91253 [Gelatoporia subvermispora B]|uniref:Cytochrome c oxidase assembly factor 3 n=1 Tax=Ceriporiopsis subvermispora (strain B) TaxID=914234 RepID=M2R7Y0_CERS8|nr:hypothetical protein CERSUDRAFT_91253 [Gelatoporia subvermispora B]
MQEQPYVPKNVVEESYRPGYTGMSPGLQRARAPFRVRNAITGITLFAFSAGIWAYSIGAVKQDEFTDVDEEARALRQSSLQNAPSQVAEAAGIAEDATTGVVPLDGATVPIQTIQSSPAVVVDTSNRPRGLLAPILARHFPRMLDPTTKTLVWGAPPVDRIGKLRDSVSQD